MLLEIQDNLHLKPNIDIYMHYEQIASAKPFSDRQTIKMVMDMCKTRGWQMQVVHKIFWIALNRLLN